jgi:hypothetical protein
MTAVRGTAPERLIRALPDPDGVDLDRTQDIKGWLDKDGATHERIHAIAVFDDRIIGRAHQQVGSSFNIEMAACANSTEDAMLATDRDDPDLDPAEPAFCYARVIEIPEPRWTTDDTAFYGIKRAGIVAETVQDRAYTSPVSYRLRRLCISVRATGCDRPCAQELRWLLWRRSVQIRLLQHLLRSDAAALASNVPANAPFSDKIHKSAL